MIHIACATDDGRSLIDRHFGEARFFSIYEVDETGWRLREMIENISIDGVDSDGHGDALKAKHVMMLLRGRGVRVLMNKRFGPNINRMIIRFLPLISAKDLIEDSLEDVRENLELIMKEYNKGGERKPLKISSTLKEEN